MSGRYVRPAGATSVPARWVSVVVAPRSLGTIDADRGYTAEVFGRARIDWWTMRGPQRIRCGHAYASSADDVWSLLADHMAPRGITWIVSPDLTAVMTWCDLFRRAERGDIAIMTLVDGDPPALARLRWRGRTLVWCDPANWTRADTAELAALCDVPLPDAPEPWSTDTDVSAYLDALAVTTARAIETMARIATECDLGPWRWTVGAASRAGWSRSAMGCRVLVHDALCVRELERAAQYGALLACYYRGRIGPRDDWRYRPDGTDMPVSVPRLDGPCHHLDVRGMYPARMAEEEYPVELLGHSTGLRVADLARVLDRGDLAIASVTVQCHSHSYPHRGGGRVGYCRGRFGCALTTPELRQALSCGEILHVHEVAWYRAGRPFADFVARLQTARRAEEKKDCALGKRLVKLVADSLWGKLGQLTAPWRDCPDVPAQQPWGQWSRVASDGTITQYRSVAWSTQVRMPRVDHKESIPSISAHVTAYARVWMLRAIATLPPRSVYYVDTDGIYCSSVAVTAAEDAGLVGVSTDGLFARKGASETAFFRGLKDYDYGAKHVISGLRTGALEISENSWAWTEYPRLTSVIDVGATEVVIGASRIYHRGPGRVIGTIGPDGWVTPPVL